MRDLWLLGSRWRKKHLEYFSEVEFEGECRERERERGRERERERVREF